MAAAGPSKGQPCRRVLVIEIQLGHPTATLPHRFIANLKPNIKWLEELNAFAPLGNFYYMLLYWNNISTVSKQYKVLKKKKSDSTHCIQTG